MRMIRSTSMNDTVTFTSNVPENDHAAYNSSTTYALGARVIVVADHAVYESAEAGNQGNTPSSSSQWLRVGSTNRWRAFDNKTGQATQRSGSITYAITLPALCTAVAMVGLQGRFAKVVIKDQGTKIYEKTIQLLDVNSINSYFTYRTFQPMFEFDSQALFEDVPGDVGNVLEITIDATGGTAAVGEIIFGKGEVLGGSLEGTEIGFDDLSIISRDPFGNVEIVDRGSYNEVTFRFAIPIGGEGRVRKLISTVQAKPALFYASADITSRGTTIFGLAKPLRIPLAVAGVSFATLEVEELS